MRYALLLPMACLIAFSGCKKDKNDEEKQTVRPEDSKALSSAIKVWHGVRISGNPPAPNNNPNGPVLDPSTNNQTIKGWAGRYAILMPELISGGVAGYHVKVNGADDYFKIDYSQPRLTGGRLSNATRKPSFTRALSRGLKMDSTGNGTLDSSIVISIPASVQPGQFCITYWAYDSSGNVSNPITSCITVAAFGSADPSVSFLQQGTWHITGWTDDTTAGWEPVFGVGDTMFYTGYCVNNKVVDTFGTGPGFFDYPADLYIVDKSDMNFGSNGGLQYKYSETYKTFDFVNSTCSNYVFEVEPYEETIHGAWTYTASSQTMVLLFEFDDLGQAVAEAWEYKFQKVHNGKFYLFDPWEGWLRFEK